jgi:hypothetical protein
MRVYTVIGLADESAGELYVAGVFPGQHRTLDASPVTRVPGAGHLSRWAGHFEADSADEAEKIAVDVVGHARDEDTLYWPPGSRQVKTVPLKSDLL